MRIIGGRHRGRTFNLGKRFKHRPTTDIAKEGLFNILQNRVDFDKLNILDLFAGTGNISFEFASRGCEDVTAVELSFQHYRIIQDIAKELEEKAVKPIKADAFKFCEKTEKVFDIIFADPPYNHKRFREIPDLILSSNILNPNGLFILEHSKDYDFSDREEYTETRKYGSVHFSFFTV
ncbi:MAG: 16S rRNA (guanine(966)-N(2))-methyltransferase RsmD [Mangrovibacterium sp.]